MPVARFEMPDGRIGRFEVPEGTTPENAQSLIEQHLSGNDKPSFFQNVSRNFDQRRAMEQELADRAAAGQKYDSEALAEIALSRVGGPIGDVVTAGIQSAAPYVPQGVKDAASKLGRGIQTAGSFLPGMESYDRGVQKIMGNERAMDALGAVGNALNLTGAGLGARVAAPIVADATVATGRAVINATRDAIQGVKNIATLPEKNRVVAAGLRKEARQEASQSYDEAAYFGETFNAEEIASPVTKRIKNLTPDMLKGRHTEEGLALIKDLEDYKHLDGQNMTLDEVRIMDRELTDKIDKHVNKVTGEVEGNHGRALLELQDELRNAADAAGGNGVTALNNAKGAWSAQRTLGDIERVLLRASMTTNEATAVQNGIRQLRMRYRGKDKKIMSLMDNAGKTHITDDAVGLVGTRLIPIGHLAMGDISGAAITAATGMAARSGKAALVVNRVNKLAEYVAKKGTPKGANPLSKEPEMALRLTDQRIPLRERALARKAKADAEKRALGPNQRAYAPAEQKLLPSPDSPGTEIAGGRRLTMGEEATNQANRQKEKDMGLTGTRKNLSRLKIRKELGPTFDALEAAQKKQIMDEINEMWLGQDFMKSGRRKQAVDRANEQLIPITDIIEHARRRVGELSTTMSDALLRAKKK